MGNSAPHRKTLPLVRLEGTVDQVALTGKGRDPLKNGMRRTLVADHLELRVGMGNILVDGGSPVTAIVPSHSGGLGNGLDDLLVLAHVLAFV